MTVKNLSIRPDFLRGVDIFFWGGYPEIPMMLSTNVVVSLNGGTPKSSILLGFSIINHPFWGTFIFGNTNVVVHFDLGKLTANIGMVVASVLSESVASVNPPCWRMRMSRICGVF